MFQINKIQRLNPRNLSSFVAIAVICFSTAGCNEKEDSLLANPVTQEVGVFEGCSVKFVDRGLTTVG